MADQLEVLDEIEVRPTQTEIGATGVMVVRGDVFNMEDYVPELQGDRAMALYEEMRSSDAQIDAAYFHLTAPIVSSQWTVKTPASGTDKAGNAVSTKEDQKAADFVKRQTVDWDFLQDGSGWSGFVAHAALMAIFGAMPFEKVWGVTSDGYQVIRKLAPRHPKSVILYHIGRDRELEYMQQWAWGPEGFAKFTIPADRLVPFVYRKEGDNWWGRSLLRSCYMPWSIWRQLAIVDAMRHERHGMGIPVLECPPGSGKKEMEQAKKVVKELRAHERQYVKLPPGFKLSWYFPTGSGTDILGSMRYWDELKVRALHNEIMTLGANVSGARNLGETKQKAAFLAVQGFAGLISSVVKKHVTAPMVRMNLGPGAPVPDVEIEDLDALDVTQLAETLKAFREGDFIVPDDPLETFLRRKMKLTSKQMETARAKAQAILPGALTDGMTQEERRELRTRRMREAGMLDLRTFGLARAPLVHEAHCAFEEYVEFMDGEPVRIWDDVVKPIRTQQVREVVSAASKATTKELSTGGISRKRLMRNRLAADLFDALKRSYRRGRLSIKEEMGRQRAGEAPERPNTASEAGAVLGARADLLEPAAQELARVRRIAELFAETVTEDMVKRAQEVALRARVAGLEEGAVADRVLRALEALSEAKVKSSLEGDVVAAFTYGRNDAAGAVESEVEAAYYSAIMDEGTCGPCAALDGEQHEVGDERFATPNPNCEWPPHCRCVTVYVFKREGPLD